jgi:ABC-type Fe3+ transport system substrate-binding protein
MLSRVANLVALAAMVAVPFLLRPREKLLDKEGEALVIVTPHHEAIRYEFGRAFRVHMRETKGRSVHVDWRTPGGTNEIARYVASEYAAAFEIYWKDHVGRPFTATVASAFSNPQVRWNEPGPDETEKLARRTFLESNVGIGIDLMFGGGGQTFVRHAASGWFVDSGFVRAHPELMNDAVLPETLGSTRFWDREGRWVGTCLSSFGICFNKGVLERLGVRGVPASWRDLADPVYSGQLALADPTKSGSAATAFEMVVQEQMNLRAAELESSGAGKSDVDARAPREGWDRAMRLIRRLGANARYFTDAAPKIAIDVATGDAAAGMCIDFYGRFQSETTAHGGPSRIGFAMPRGGTSIDADAIALMRGAPHRELATEFIDFVLSREGQKLWNFKVGAPGGPERYALRRLPVLPELYAPEYDALRSDPGERPFEQAREFVYHAAWTAPLLRSLSFVVRVMCVDTERDLSDAYRALFSHGFPARATAAFDDVGLVGYDAAAGTIRTALTSGNPLDEVDLGNRLIVALREQYRTVVELARSAP